MSNFKQVFSRPKDQFATKLSYKLSYDPSLIPNKFESSRLEFDKLMHSALNDKSSDKIPLLKQIDAKKTSILNNVIVLIDSKNYNRIFLSSIGVTLGCVTLCSVHVPTKIFTYQIYSLNEISDKIIKHVEMNAGLIIIIDIIKYNESIKRIESYSILSIPILIILEYHSNIIKTMLDYNIKYITNSNIRYQMFNIFLNTNTNNFASDNLDNLLWFNNRVLSFKNKILNNEISDEQLVHQFVNKSLPINDWNHYNRLRIVYFSLKYFGYMNTVSQDEWLCVKWNQYKKSIGHSHLWNYTLTKFWIDNIYNLMVKNLDMNFKTLYNKYTYLNDGNLHKKYYTNDVLFSEEARKTWIKPNII